MSARSFRDRYAVRWGLPPRRQLSRPPGRPGRCRAVHDRRATPRASASSTTVSTAARRSPRRSTAFQACLRGVPGRYVDAARHDLPRHRDDRPLRRDRDARLPGRDRTLQRRCVACAPVLHAPSRRRARRCWRRWRLTWATSARSSPTTAARSTCRCWRRATECTGRRSLSPEQHIDLLSPARAIWKHRLPSCSLGTIERMVLGVERELDAPGWMIPQLYFDYLRSRRIDTLEPVFEHNRIDIVTLARLTALVQTYEAGIRTPANDIDRLAVALHRLRRHGDDDAIESISELWRLPTIPADLRLAGAARSFSRAQAAAPARGGRRGMACRATRPEPAGAAVRCRGTGEVPGAPRARPRSRASRSPGAGRMARRWHAMR